MRSLNNFCFDLILERFVDHYFLGDDSPEINTPFPSPPPPPPKKKKKKKKYIYKRINNINNNKNTTVRTKTQSSSVKRHRTDSTALIRFSWRTIYRFSPVDNAENSVWAPHGSKREKRKKEKSPSEHRAPHTVGGVPSLLRYAGVPGMCLSSRFVSVIPKPLMNRVKRLAPKVFGRPVNTQSPQGE